MDTIVAGSYLTWFWMWKVDSVARKMGPWVAFANVKSQNQLLFLSRNGAARVKCATHERNHVRVYACFSLSLPVIVELVRSRSIWNSLSALAGGGDHGGRLLSCRDSSITTESPSAPLCFIETRYSIILL